MDHHLTNYFGASFEKHMEVQTNFLKQRLRMNINSWEWFEYIADRFPGGRWYHPPRHCIIFGNRKKQNFYIFPPSCVKSQYVGVTLNFI